MANSAIQFGRSLRPSALEVRETSYNQIQILFGKLSDEKWSANITVGTEPVVIKVFGFVTGQEIVVYNVFRNIREKMFYNGEPFVLTPTNNVLVLALAGVYALYTEAVLGAIRCIAYPLSALDKKAQQSTHIKNPNGPHSAQPNTYFDGSAGKEISQEFFVGTTPQAFRAYGVIDQVIELVQLFDGLEAQVVENGTPVQMDAAHTALVVTIAGRYKFRLVGSSLGVVVAVNPTLVNYSDPFIKKGDKGEQGAPGEPGGTITKIDGGNF